VTQDSWVFIADDAPLNADFNIVSQSRWRKEKAKTLKRVVECAKEQSASHKRCASYRQNILRYDVNVFELHIPVFTDGRVFTQARLLRSRFGFTGDIRVSGDFMRDQVFYLSRVGVSSFELNDQEDAQGIITSMEDFSDANN
jgi:uncharacterized protein (DUF934 family)